MRDAAAAYIAALAELSDTGDAYEELERFLTTGTTMHAHIDAILRPFITTDSQHDAFLELVDELHGIEHCDECGSDIEPYAGTCATCGHPVA